MSETAMFYPREDGLYDVTITLDRVPVPCPSPWRHPVEWLRWNPYLRGPQCTWTVYGAQIRHTPEGIEIEMPPRIAYPRPG